MLKIEMGMGPLRGLVGAQDLNSSPGFESKARFPHAGQNFQKEKKTITSLEFPFCVSRRGLGGRGRGAPVSSLRRGVGLVKAQACLIWRRVAEGKKKKGWGREQGEAHTSPAVS